MAKSAVSQKGVLTVCLKLKKKLWLELYFLFLRTARFFSYMILSFNVIYGWSYGIALISYMHKASRDFILNSGAHTSDAH